MTAHVPPDGPIPARWMVCAEAPAQEEVKQGRGLVGPSGRLLWPMMRRLASIERGECYVTNLCKHPLDNDISGDLKLSDEEFERCRVELIEEVRRVQPERILAVGTLAAKALLGDDFTAMYACNGVGFEIRLNDVDHSVIVIPTWHPAAALRPGGEDRLAWTGAAIKQFRTALLPALCSPPRPKIWGEGGEYTYPIGGLIGLDTEGTPEDPICLTWAQDDCRVYVSAKDAREFWSKCTPGTIVYHNAPWDWDVMEAMGIEEPWKKPYVDTMEPAYLRQTEPQGLKDLAWRHLRVRAKTFEETVQPYYHAALRAEATSYIEATTTFIHTSPKGRPLKKPKVVLTDRAKSLKRALGNPELLAKRLESPPISLRYVPQEVLMEYSTLDPWLTLKLWERWQ